MRHLVSVIAVLVAGLLVSAPAHAIGPSFDCAKASSANERMICADGQLSALDYELAQAYGTLLSIVSGAQEEEIRDVQRQWLQARQACGSDYQCTIGAYSSRTQQLQMQTAHAGGGGNPNPGPPDWADGPSFDCRRAATRNEVLICNSAELSSLDLEMAQAYYTLLDQVPAYRAEAMRDVQQRWLQDRQACGGNYGCTANAYDSRIYELHQELGW